MKKIKILILIIFLITGCKVLKDSYSKKDDNSLAFLKDINKSAYLNTFTIYGRFFNISGYLNEEIDNLILVFKTFTYETEYNLILEKSNNKTFFKTTELINQGINLENINIGEYVILLKTKKDNQDIYYNIENKTKYSNLNYYTITKNNSNKEIKINFLNQDNINYLSLKCEKIKLPNEYYDIVIDPGHGGIDVGANKNGYYESKINLDYAKSLKTSLEKLGLKVKLTRDEDITLANYGKNSRISVPYQTKAKLMLSIHQNSAATNIDKGGLEVYAVNNTDITFAKSLVSNISKYTSSPISKNVAYKVENGVYIRTLSEQDLKDIEEEALEKGYKPYEKATTSSTYYYMIREVGGIITDSYVDMRNKEKEGNIYYDSNHGTEAYLLEIGYINSTSNLKIILNEKEKFVKAITLSVKDYLDL